MAVKGWGQHVYLQGAGVDKARPEDECEKGRVVKLRALCVPCSRWDAHQQPGSPDPPLSRQGLGEEFLSPPSKGLEAGGGTVLAELMLNSWEVKTMRREKLCVSVHSPQEAKPREVLSGPVLRTESFS